MEIAESTQTKNTSSKVRISISIPDRSIWSTLASIALIYLTYLQMVWYILPSFEVINTFTLENLIMKNIGYVWPPIICYALFAVTSCTIVNIFTPIKKSTENGIIASFSYCGLYFLVLGLASTLLELTISNEGVGGVILIMIAALLTGLSIGIALESK